MAPYVPEEVNVFSVPHSRMKELVNSYFAMVQSTNFSSTVDLETLLASLYKTFTEFKTHEHIENKLIMRKLRTKMRQLARQNSAVCNCHKGSRLEQMLHLLEDGFNKSTVQDRINYGLKLTKELEDFTSSFLPHMEQEEEVFQPLLLQYFTYEELCQLKQKVIEQHFHNIENEQCQQFAEEKFTWTESEKEFTARSKVGSADSSTSSESEDDESNLATLTSCSALQTTTAPAPTAIVLLPVELLLHILSFLSVKDICRCAQVCWSWNHVTKDSRLWTNLLPTQWAQGVWSSCVVDTAANVDWVQTDDVTAAADVDIDETYTAANCQLLSMSRDRRILSGLTNYLLPSVHRWVRKLVINNSSTLDDCMLDNILSLCSNIQHLDLSHCSVSDTGLKRLRGRTIVSLVLSGCVNITDATLINCFSPVQRRCSTQQCSRSICSIIEAGTQNLCSRDFANVYLLEHLDVSGCWRLTDGWLRAVCESCVLLPRLRHLDLSGCMLLSGSALNLFVNSVQCPSLLASSLYYCDNITDGPFPLTASGCRNLQCGTWRVCCRTGH